MIYESIFEQAAKKQINAGLIGSGTYGISLLAQTLCITRLNIPVICDQDPQITRQACVRAGIPEDKIKICSERSQLLLAIENGDCAIAENYELMLDTPLDVITCLRREDEAGPGGGVFLVFGCKNDDTWKFMRAKGLIVNRRGTCGIVYRPYHLLGVETPISILCAGLLNLSTGSLQYKPRLDLIAKTRIDLKAGSRIPLDHGDVADTFEYSIVPASPIDSGNPIPFYMAAGNQIAVDVPAGTTITCDMIAEPEDSRLWELRRQQDRRFTGVLE